MKRERLRRIIALCILEVLPHSSLSFQNVKRYVTTQTLTLYRIRNETKITQTDLLIGLKMAINSCRNKPISFRYAPLGSPKAEERKQYLLTAPLPDLIKS